MSTQTGSVLESKPLATGVPGAVKRSRYWLCRAPSTLWCQTLFFLTPPSPSLLLLLRRLPPSFLTSLIWNPSSNSGRRGRTHQLLMYSQCRGKREGRLPNVPNTPVEVLGPAFVVWWDSAWNTRAAFSSPLGKLLPFFPGGRRRLLLFWLSEFQFAGNLMGKSVPSCSADKP